MQISNYWQKSQLLETQRHCYNHCDVVAPYGNQTPSHQSRHVIIMAQLMILQFTFNLRFETVDIVNHWAINLKEFNQIKCF